MKPETEHFVEQARNTERRARTMIQAGLNEDAGRGAYLICFHAAQALIFEFDERVVKTHSGAHSEFHRLTNNDPRIDRDLVAFLSQAFEYKAEADYFNTPGYTMSRDEAVEAVETAVRFLEQVLNIVSSTKRSETA